MKKVQINSYTDFLCAYKWCYEQFGPDDQIWTTDLPPQKGFGIAFKTPESYALFMLRFITDLKFLSH